ncbi:protein GRAVITROPIC IN THE LIGHT 1 isoform X2 [Andrographis paniculata]|uniref:protein GRAVITROPIC IN THE LIGHT 1 isoform X2 n=1 Tax=Andrographis paniculata TaxID=175694 RepID=UPI0021E8934D|nr:protein GRAVITROPIC IN THE LIGHT 1 isoform X2 [Andrographis paniculata]
MLQSVKTCQSFWAKKIELGMNDEDIYGAEERHHLHCLHHCHYHRQQRGYGAHPSSVPFRGDPLQTCNNSSLKCHNNNNYRSGQRLKKRMTSKVSNFSDLIQRVTANCLLHPLAGISRADELSVADEEEEEVYQNAVAEEEEDDDDDEEDYRIGANWEDAKHGEDPPPPAKVMELQVMMNQVFDAVSAMKKAYVSLQEAHCPWDPDKMRVADVAVVAELRRLGLLRERFRRSVGGGGRWPGMGIGIGMGAATLREVVAPYEAAMEQLKREVKAKQVEVENLRDKLKTATSFDRSAGGGGKSKGKSKRRVSCSTQVAPAPAPASELFESTMTIVKEASKSFTALLLALMRSAHWDIAAAVRSIEAASSATATTAAPFLDSVININHAKYALESYVNRKIFQGFDHETFYMDGSLSSILHPDQHRRDCFTQYRDMKAMDPVELLGILPTCGFGNFCFKKYLSIVHPKMEESLFGDLEQRRQVLDGHHPRSQFYGEFLGLAKAVWLLHLLAFSLDPPPSHFEASRGAEFHSQYMESVVRIGRESSMVVGFPVSPGFKLGNGSIIRARVYLVPKN